MRDDRAAEIAPHEPRQIETVLYQDRLVEAVVLTQLRVPHRIDSTLARHRLDRVARNEADEHKHQERDPDEGRYHEAQPGENEPEHDPLPPGESKDGKGGVAVAAPPASQVTL
jgi:hypothetical protein